MIYLRTVNPGYGSIELHAEEDAYLAVNDYAYGCCNDPLDMLCDLIQTLNFSKVLLLRCSCIWSAHTIFQDSAAAFPYRAKCHRGANYLASSQQLCMRI